MISHTVSGVCCGSDDLCGSPSVRSGNIVINVGLAADRTSVCTNICNICTGNICGFRIHCNFIIMLKSRNYFLCDYNSTAYRTM